MSLDATVKSGLQLLNKVAKDLLISTFLKRPNPITYVPGSDIVETYTQYPVTIFIDKFSYQELQSTMISDTDIKIMFTELNGIVPQIADIVNIGLLSYRLTTVKPIFVATEVVAAESVGRPV